MSCLLPNAQTVYTLCYVRAQKLRSYSPYRGIGIVPITQSWIFEIALVVFWGGQNAAGCALPNSSVPLGLWYRREVQRQQVFQYDAFADKLKADCLTYLYRLLFLFHVEARGVELGVVRMNSDSYRMGYSLEFLRDFELQPLTSPDARDGYFLSDSLNKLFTIVYRGFPESRAQSGELLTDGFLVDPLRGPLFDPDKLAVLRNVRLRNHVVQDVIQLLSLSEEKGRRDRGRISYANLGINQLGSVYDGLLSYSGFFAKEDLYEVQAEGDASEEEGSTKQAHAGSAQALPFTGRASRSSEMGTCA